MEIVINADFGGFSLSRDAFLGLRKMGNKHAIEEPDIGEMWPDGSGPRQDDIGAYSFLRDIPRDDRDLISVIKDIGKKANGRSASLKIVEIPDDVKWGIHEYDGSEHVEEQHRTWS